MNAKTGRGNAYVTPLRDTNFGRIYRVYPQNTPDDPLPDLDITDPATLVAGLSHENLFWRIEAQRLLVESKATGTVATLKELVGKSEAAAMHAFGALDGLGALDAMTVATALKSPHRGLRRLAVSHPLADPMLASSFTHDGVLTGCDPRELAEVFAGLGRTKPSDETGRLLHTTLVKNQGMILDDRTLADGWQIAARRHAKGVLLATAGGTVEARSAPLNLLPNPGFEEGGPMGWSLRIYNARDRSKVSIRTVPGGRSGNCLMIHSEAAADAGAGAEITVKPNTRYRYGGWVRTENMQLKGGLGALFNIHATDSKTTAISGDKDWTQLSTEFRTGNQTRVLIHCLFGGYGGATGTAYWDDVYLHEVGSGDITSLLEPLASHFSATGPSADLRALADTLASRTDDFSKSIVASLNTKQAATKPMVRRHQPDPAVHARGLEVYNRTCIACHGPEGKGVPGAFPPLDGAPLPVGEPSVPIRIIIHGLQGPLEVAGQTYNVPMAALPDLKDAEVADVLTYVRQSWSNDAAPVSAETVRQVRAKHADRKTPWTIGELK
jgi:mono/diheme cytochrome c family protein